MAWAATQTVVVHVEAASFLEAIVAQEGSMASIKEVEDQAIQAKRGA
jgi:hypothetical protein